MRVRAAVTAAFLLATMSPAPSRAATIDYIQPVGGPIVRHFEPPPTPYTAGHRGIDIAAPVGTDVIAAAEGTVHFAGQVGGSLFVSIDHPDGIRTTYSFLSAVLVRAGAYVAQGQLIARSGPGHAGDPQPDLHFGALRAGAYIDPEQLLVDGVRRNIWRVVHLAPVEEPDEPATR
jgi:murein DD-endopeptidase MepM/ murein hydrolase activator NlpD